MRIAILGTPKGWHVTRCREAAETLGHETVVAPFEKLHAMLSGESAPLHMGRLDLMTCDRVLVRSVPPGSLEQIVFRMDALHRLQSAGIPVLNPPGAIEACVDKYLASARLQAAGLPIPRTAVCEDLDEAMEAFERLGGSVVIKPLFGSEGRGMLHADDPSIAYRVLRTLCKLQSVLYLQEHVRHPGYDLRAFVLGNRVLAAMRRRSVDDFRTNVARGGIVEPCDLSDDLAELAVRAAQAIGAPQAGVDLLPGPDGETYVLEVNSAPGFKALAETTRVDIPGAIIRYLVDADWRT